MHVANGRHDQFFQERWSSIPKLFVPCLGFDWQGWSYLFANFCPSSNAILEESQLNVSWYHYKCISFIYILYIAIRCIVHIYIIMSCLYVLCIPHSRKLSIAHAASLDDLNFNHGIWSGQIAGSLRAHKLKLAIKGETGSDSIAGGEILDEATWFQPKYGHKSLWICYGVFCLLGWTTKDPDMVHKPFQKWDPTQWVRKALLHCWCVHATCRILQNMCKQQTCNL